MDGRSTWATARTEKRMWTAAYIEQPEGGERRRLAGGYRFERPVGYIRRDTDGEAGARDEDVGEVLG